MTNRKLEYIVKDQRPLTLSAHETVQHACQCMRERNAGSVLVIDEQQRLRGIFTGRDAVRTLASGKPDADAPLARAMTADPVHMAPGSTAIHALRLMQDGGFRHVPICDQGRVVGIVSQGDFRGEEHARLDIETGIWERL